MSFLPVLLWLAVALDIVLDLADDARHTGGDNVDGLAVFDGFDLRLAIEHIEKAALVVGQVDHYAARPLVEELIDAREQVVHAFAGLGADVDAVLPVRADIAEVEVGLVVNAQAGNLLRAELFDELVHDLRLLEPVRVGNVDDVQQKIGVFKFLERCLERLDKLMRQLSNEADRVGDHDIQRVGHGEKPRRRVQRVKQAVIRGNTRACQRVQER